MNHSLYDLLSLMFDDLDLEYSFSPLEIAIYWRLVHRCNFRKWKNPFPFACDDLRAKVRCKNAESKKAFDTARNRLKQAGLLDYKGGNGRGNVTVYTLYLPQKGSIKGVQIEPLSAPFSAPLSAHFSELPKKERDREEESQEDDTPKLPHPISPPEEKSGKGGVETVEALPPVERSPKKPPKPRAPKVAPHEPDGVMVAGWYEALRLYPLTTNTNTKSAQKAYYAAIERVKRERGGENADLVQALNERVAQFARMTKSQGQEGKFIMGFNRWLEEENWHVVRLAGEVTDEDDDGMPTEEQFQQMLKSLQ